MRGDDVGIGGRRRRWHDPRLGLAGSGSGLRVLDRLSGLRYWLSGLRYWLSGLRYRLNGVFDLLARLLGGCLAGVPLVILHRAMDLHPDRFEGLES
jgi:hypothetical protein